MFSASSSDAKNYRDRKFSASGIDRFSVLGEFEPGIGNHGTKDTDEKRSQEERRSEGWTRPPKPTTLAMDDINASLKSTPSTQGCLRNSCGNPPDEPRRIMPFSTFKLPPQHPKSRTSPFQTTLDARFQSQNTRGQQVEPLRTQLTPKGTTPYPKADLSASTRSIWNALFACRRTRKHPHPTSSKFKAMPCQRSLDGILLNTQALKTKTKSVGSLTERVRLSAALR